MEKMNSSEQVILARIRTLLALERNYLAEERTALAELRTGLALVLIGPPASGIVTYITPHIQAEVTALLFTFLIIICAVGIWTSVSSRSKLKKIRKKKRILKDREALIIRSTKAVYDLLGDIILDEGM